MKVEACSKNPNPPIPGPDDIPSEIPPQWHDQYMRMMRRPELTDREIAMRDPNFRECSTCPGDGVLPDKVLFQHSRVSCPECHHVRHVRPNLDDAVKCLGYSQRIPLLHPGWMNTEHPATVNAARAFENLQTNDDGHPVGGVGLGGVNGSGKSTAFGLLLGRVIRKWPWLRYSIWPSGRDLHRLLGASQLTPPQTDELACADVIAIDDWRPWAFKTPKPVARGRTGMHAIVDRAYCGACLLILVTTLDAGDVGQNLLPDTARRLRHFGFPGSVPFDKDTGCPWAEPEEENRKQHD